jgi:hypothetical protein
VLEMKKNCERCKRDLPGDSQEATICSFECTFCSDCSANDLKGVCPNCGGELIKRPTRVEKRA